MDFDNEMGMTDWQGGEYGEKGSIGQTGNVLLLHSVHFPSLSLPVIHLCLSLTVCVIHPCAVILFVWNLLERFEERGIKRGKR